MVKITPYTEVIQTPCQPVVEPFSDLSANVWEMIEFLKARNGLGLAAPQIGDFRTYFVVNYGPKPLIVINPSVILMVEGSGYSKHQEGCYSLLGKMFEVKRAKKIQATWYDLLGRKQDAILTGILSYIFQHEFQHCQNSCIAMTGKRVIK